VLATHHAWDGCVYMYARAMDNSVRLVLGGRLPIPYPCLVVFVDSRFTHAANAIDKDFPFRFIDILHAMIKGVFYLNALNIAISLIWLVLFRFGANTAPYVPYNLYGSLSIFGFVILGSVYLGKMYSILWLTAPSLVIEGCDVVGALQRSAD